MKWQEKNYSFPLPLRYVLSQPKSPQISPQSSEGLVLLLHGYQDSAQSMLKRLGWLEGDLPFQYLAVNGPFPVPVWNAEGYKEAYSWYFRDTSRDLVLVQPSTTAERLNQWLKDLNLAERPLVLFGFSQGGYLAPFLAKHLPNVRSIIGLGCGYTEEGYANLKPLDVWALHGSLDDRIDLEKSKSEHTALLTKGFRGEFIEIPNVGHKVDPAIEPKLRELIAKSLAE